MSGHLARYLETLSRTQQELSSGFRALRHRHPREPDLSGVCERLAAQCRDHAERLEPFLLGYGSTGLRAPRSAPAAVAEPGAGEPLPAESLAAEAGTSGTGPPGPEARGFAANGFAPNGFGTVRLEGFGAGSFAAGGANAEGCGPGMFDGGQLDGGQFSDGEFDVAEVDTRGRDARGADGRGFDGAGFEGSAFEVAAFEAAGLETADLRRVARGAAERKQAGAEKPDSAVPRRARMSPGGGGAGFALLRDLHGLYLLASECDLSWSVVALAARGLRDDDLLGLARHCARETAVQLLWLRTRMRQAAPQVLVAPPRWLPESPLET